MWLKCGLNVVKMWLNVVFPKYFQLLKYNILTTYKLY